MDTARESDMMLDSDTARNWDMVLALVSAPVTVTDGEDAAADQLPDAVKRRRDPSVFPGFNSVPCSEHIGTYSPKLNKLYIF